MRTAAALSGLDPATVPLQYRPAAQRPFVETGLIIETYRTILDAHTDSGLVCVTGPQGMGKTTMMSRLVLRLNADASKGVPGAYRARMFEAGGDPLRKAQATLRRGVLNVYDAVVGPLSDRAWERATVEQLSGDIVAMLRRRGEQMLAVDEAGTLSMQEIRGLAYLHNRARALEWPLTVVLIGMDDLATKLEQLPHIRGRVQEWCYFEPYDLDETAQLLKQLNPHFAKLDLATVDGTQQVKFLHERFGGVPRNLMRFLRRLERRMLEDCLTSVNADYIQAVYVDLESHRARARRAVQEGFFEHPQADPDLELPDSDEDGQPPAVRAKRHKAPPNRTALHASKRRKRARK